MLGDMASSIFGNANPVSSNSKVESSLNSLALENWSSLRQRLEAMQTPEERAFRDNLAKGYGVGSPLHLVRLYNEQNREEDIRVTFYRDSASWCKLKGEVHL
jgi:glutathione S-transferase